MGWRYPVRGPLLCIISITMCITLTQAAPPDAYCGPCDVRACPNIQAESCPGLVVKDPCNCCPVCEMDNSQEIQDFNSEIYAKNESGCASVKCPRMQICILNIQGLPLCRCPSVYHCRQYNRKPICGRDGNTYKNRCYLQMAECSQSKKIRVAHLSPCSKQDRIREREEKQKDRDEKRKVRQERKKSRQEKKKRKEERLERKRNKQRRLEKKDKDIMADMDNERDFVLTGKESLPQDSASLTSRELEKLQKKERKRRRRMRRRNKRRRPQPQQRT